MGLLAVGVLASWIVFGSGTAEEPRVAERGLGHLSEAGTQESVELLGAEAPAAPARTQVEPETGLIRPLVAVEQEPVAALASLRFRALRSDGRVLGDAKLLVTVSDGGSVDHRLTVRTDALGFAETEAIECGPFRREPSVHVGWAGDERSGGGVGAVASAVAPVDGRNELGDVVLQRPREAHPVPVLSGRMVEATGEPIVGAMPILSLPGCESAEAWLSSHGGTRALWTTKSAEPDQAPSRPNYSATRSDGEGRFWIYGPDFGARKSLVLLGAPEHHGLPALEIELDGGAEVLWRAVELQRVSGRFLWPEGCSADGYYLTHVKGLLAYEGRWGRSEYRARIPVELGSDGSFAIDAGVNSLSLELGIGLQAINSVDVWSWSWPAEDSEEKPDPTSTALDLGVIDLREKLVRVELEVVDAGGLPAVAGSVDVQPINGSMFGRAESRKPKVEDGQVVVWLPKRIVVVMLEVQVPGSSPGVQLQQWFGPFTSLGIEGRRPLTQDSGSDPTVLPQRLVLDDLVAMDGAE